MDWALVSLLLSELSRKADDGEAVQNSGTEAPLKGGRTRAFPFALSRPSRLL
jgi:hypothetical protein